MHISNQSTASSPRSLSSESLHDDGNYPSNSSLVSHKSAPLGKADEKADALMKSYMQAPPKGNFSLLEISRISLTFLNFSWQWLSRWKQTQGFQRRQQLSIQQTCPSACHPSTSATNRPWPTFKPTQPTRRLHR